MQYHSHRDMLLANSDGNSTEQKIQNDEYFRLLRSNPGSANGQGLDKSQKQLSKLSQH